METQVVPYVSAISELSLTFVCYWLQQNAPHWRINGKLKLNHSSFITFSLLLSNDSPLLIWTRFTDSHLLFLFPVSFYEYRWEPVLPLKWHWDTINNYWWRRALFLHRWRLPISLRWLDQYFANGTGQVRSLVSLSSGQPGRKTNHPDNNITSLRMHLKDLAEHISASYANIWALTRLHFNDAANYQLASHYKSRYTIYYQHDSNSCGGVCLAITREVSRLIMAHRYNSNNKCIVTVVSFSILGRHANSYSQLSALVQSQLNTDRWCKFKASQSLRRK